MDLHVGWFGDNHGALRLCQVPSAPEQLHQMGLCTHKPSQNAAPAVGTARTALTRNASGHEGSAALPLPCANPSLHHTRVAMRTPSQLNVLICFFTLTDPSYNIESIQQKYNSQRKLFLATTSMAPIEVHLTPWYLHSASQLCVQSLSFSLTESEQKTEPHPDCSDIKGTRTKTSTAWLSHSHCSTALTDATVYGQNHLNSPRSHNVWIQNGFPRQRKKL